MSKSNHADVAIVGGGIAGLAHAYMCLKKGKKVVLFERDPAALGASVRNFGLIWPIGQLPGEGLDLAYRGRMHWLELAGRANLWINQNGSLHLAYHEDEWAVLNEFVSWNSGKPYLCELLGPQATAAKSPAVKKKGLLGSLWSQTECTVNPREAVRRLPLWMEQEYGLVLRYGHTVKEVNSPMVETNRERWKADRVIVCSGADFETLFPDFFAAQSMVKCRLQMMKVRPARGFRLGPTLCAGLTLRHYAAFSSCPSLKRVNERYDRDNSAWKANGIHVLVAQNDSGDLIIGDSHHYGTHVEPFDSEAVNDLIWKYLATFMSPDGLSIVERWHGVYPRLEGRLCVIEEVQRGVTVVNGLGGAGMTLSFGVAEQVVNAL